MYERVYTQFPVISVQEQYKVKHRELMELLVHKHENAGIVYKHRVELLRYAGTFRILKFEFDKFNPKDKGYIQKQLSKLPSDQAIQKVCAEEYIRHMMKYA